MKCTGKENYCTDLAFLVFLNSFLPSEFFGLMFLEVFNFQFKVMMPGCEICLDDGEQPGGGEAFPSSF